MLKSPLNSRKQTIMGTVMQLQRRQGESKDPPFRSGRFFCVGNRWYFTTREGFDSGPYSTKQRAVNGLDRFLKVAQLIPSSSHSGRLDQQLALY
jgi:hypothetical protein